MSSFPWSMSPAPRKIGRANRIQYTSTRSLSVTEIQPSAQSGLKSLEKRPHQTGTSTQMIFHRVRARHCDYYRQVLAYLSRRFGISVSPWQKGRTYDIVISTLDGLEAFKHSAPESFTTDCQYVVVHTTATIPPIKAKTFNSSNILILEFHVDVERFSNHSSAKSR